MNVEEEVDENHTKNIINFEVKTKVLYFVILKLIYFDINSKSYFERIAS